MLKLNTGEGINSCICLLIILLDMGIVFIAETLNLSHFIGVDYYIYTIQINSCHL